MERRTSTRDFGSYDDFPRIHTDDETNTLCFESLTARIRAVARYMLKLITGRYAYQNNGWYWFDGKVWLSRVPPDDLMDTDMTKTYHQLMELYTNEKQQEWLRSLIADMGSLQKRKIYIKDLERQCRQLRHEIPLDANVHLLGFENGVFDSSDGSFRPHLPEDYLTGLLPYDLPTVGDAAIRANIEALLHSVIQDEDARNFLILTLALNLKGMNRHNMTILWTGSGEDGKTALMTLMRGAFVHLHQGPLATLLQSERLSANLSKLKHARSVFCNTRSGKKVSSVIVEALTGNLPTIDTETHRPPRFVVNVLCNEIPRFEGDLWRRLINIKFDQELADNQLNQVIESWGPQFMLFLIEAYRAYVANGRRVIVPRKVECNLDEQREENDPFPSWFRQNLERKAGNKLHVHRVVESFNASQPDDTTRYATRALTTKLRNMRIPFGTVQGKAGCDCGRKTTYLDGYDFIQEN